MVMYIQIRMECDMEQNLEVLIVIYVCWEFGVRTAPLGVLATSPLSSTQCGTRFSNLGSKVYLLVTSRLTLTLQ